MIADINKNHTTQGHPDLKERKIVETMINRMNLTTVTATMTQNMVEENRKRTAKIEESIEELDVDVDEESDEASDKVDYEEAKDKIINLVKDKSERHETDHKRKNFLKLGFIPEQQWTENDAEYCLTNDKQQEIAMTQSLADREGAGDNNSKPRSFDDIVASFSYQKTLILRENSWFTSIWFTIDIMSCIISSYLYAYMATFGGNSLNETGDIMVQFFEIVFVLSIIFNFITEYKPDGI